MSPPVDTPYSTFMEIPKPDCPSAQNLKSAESFNFSAGSTDATGFNYAKCGPEKSNLSSRSRPRLMKIRRKQMGASQEGKSVKTDLGLNGFGDVSGGLKFDGKGNVFGGNNGHSGSNGSAKSGDVNGNIEQLGNGLSLGVSLGNGKSFFGSSINSSTNNLHSKEGDFLFYSSKDSSNLDMQKENGSFLFGASKNASVVINSDPQKKDSGKNMDKSESDKDAEGTVPDMRGKVKLDTSGDSEKVSHPCFPFPFNWNDSSSKDPVNFVFGSSSSDSKLDRDLKSDSIRKNTDMSNDTNSTKENVGIDMQFHNACLNGVFVFGGSNCKEGSSSGVTAKHDNEINQAEDCNGFGQHNHNIGLDINSKFRNSSSSGGSSEKDPAFSISNEMKRLNIDDFGGDAKKTENMYVFGSCHAKSGLINENHPLNMSEKTPDVSHLSHDNSEAIGIGIPLNGGFCETPSIDKDEKDSISFTGKLAGLDSSDAGYSTPNMAFAFSSCNLFPGMDKKLDPANSKSFGGKKLKKRNGKLRQRTVVQQLFGQHRVSNEGDSQQNHNSPGCGSPMDFSPYQDTSASNAPNADIGTGVKGEFAVNEKDSSEHCEKPHDDEGNSSFSSSLPAQDGLSAVKRQYKKKYKLKVGLNHKVLGNNSDKENTKQEPIGAAAHEVCEHWRIRGNQAYHAGKLSKAEEFYSMGINLAPHVSTLGYSMKPLLLCYSNRAATRMSLGRMREAIRDCAKASELDPTFLKVTLRAGNCYLVLGEVEDAIQCYTKCLNLRNDVCLDRRITIEAADGLQKAKTVAEYMHQSAKLLQEGTENAASSALANISEALSISRFSERLLEMKGEALWILRMYEEVIQLCEQSLDIAKTNFGADNLDDPSFESSHVKLWRLHLQIKSHYRLGRLDLALDIIEKQENMPISSKSGDESSIALAATIRELLCLKRSGNEAFSSGRYTEAIENYTAAISKSSESRPFMAICFCNRAAAYQSVNQIVDAIADCSLAIALDENYQKAISRRATLHEMIRDYKQAVNDLQKLISLLESQSQTKTQQNDSQRRSSGAGSVRDLRKARRRLSLIEEKAKKEIPLDFYLILGVKSSDAESEIKKAYRKAALRHHPDKAGQVFVRSDVGDDGTLWKECSEKIHKDADRLFKIIGEAYAVLSDPSKRSNYDNEEEIRNIYRDSNRNSNSGHPSTSYSSSCERGSWYERNSSRRYWYDSRSYNNSHSRW